jgi:hypothetical protein
MNEPAFKKLDYDELFPGRFLKAGEFKGKDYTLTIVSIRLEELPQDKGGQRIRGVIGFKETKKELVLNRTNGECLRGMWGRDTSAWIGKRVTLYPAPYDGDVAIRVKGSPDLEAPMMVEVKLPRKKPRQVQMQVTGRRAAALVPADAAPPSIADAPPDLNDAPPPDHWDRIDQEEEP